LVILLAGGDKTTQAFDIRTALKLARDLEICNMGKSKLKKWDSAKRPETEEDMALYLEEAGDDAAFVAKALGTIARAKGMTPSYPVIQAWAGKAFTRCYLAKGTRALPRS
jgi:hypothetical protein